MTIDRFRVATFNIHHGAGRDGTVDVERTASVIRSLAPDLIALQEVDRGLERSSFQDQPALLSEATGMVMHFSAAISVGDGEYGLCIGGRDPEIQVAREPLPQVASEERRIAIVARWAGISVIATHLARAPRARKLQLEAIATLAGRLSPPVIVLGDLNQRAGDLQALHLAELAAGPTRRPLRWWLRGRGRVDHILAGPGLVIRRSRLVPTNASDHWPLVADIEGH